MTKQPKNPFHPGEMLLEEFLVPMGMSQAEFARQLGWTKARLNELIRGKRGQASISESQSRCVCKAARTTSVSELVSN